MSNTVVVQSRDSEHSQTDLLPANNQDIFCFDRFTVNTQHKLLLENDTEVSIEPKVFDLLVYFCKNADRYVLISELHEHVWEDRVVSDAAVRRAISKLRILLGETDNHSLIKSVHKRGYKLDCTVSQKSQDCQPEQLSLSTPQEMSLSNRLTPQSLVQRVRRIPSSVILFATLLLGTALFYLFENHSVYRSKLVNFSGEKISASTNDDTSAVVFAGKLIGEQGFQLFHATLDNQNIRQLTQNANNVTEVKFSRDQTYILFIDLSLGGSKILRKGINAESEVQILVEGFSIISDFDEAHDGSGLYFSAVRDSQGMGQVYYLDYSTGNIDAITYAHDTNSNDYHVDVSPDGEYLLVTTSMSGMEEHVLSLFNTRNRAIVKRFFHTRSLYEVTWLNDEEIVLLDSVEIIKVHVEKATRTLMGLNQGSNIIDIEPLDSGKFMVVHKSLSDSYFIEVNLPSFDTATQRILVTPGAGVSEVLYLGESNDLLYVLKEGDTAKIVMERNKEQISLLQSTMTLELLDVAPQSDFILLSLDGLLALLEIETNNVKYITTGGQMIAHDAIFNIKGDGVIYGVKERGVWKIKEYQLENQNVLELFSSFRAARQTQDKIFLLSESFTLSVYDYKTETLKELPHSLPSAENTNWYADNHYIYFSDFDGKDAHFNVFDHNGKPINEKTFNASSISASFDINPSRGKAILKSWPYSEADILLLDSNALSAMTTHP
ncbi:hypothetical protein D210916BOD24_34670 [Alteromonas sp. D210916BOD_24]|uniref:winged helix-turn-helix domain-containing protein n=1 Tax=Alteromonas sp. D210916BOD_24 TaxID=3157618 RepID=UPI00399D394E